MSVNPVPVTVLIAARNEEANLPKCLASTRRADQVIVVDSGSTDATVRIAEEHGATVLRFEYEGGYPKKRQWALDTASFPTPWVLLLDADEEVPDALWDEIAAATSTTDGHAAYFATKGFHFMGRRFRFGGFSFRAVVLIQPAKCRFERLSFEPPGQDLDMEVHERVIVDGSIGRLRTPLTHDDFKGLSAYIARHNSYSTWEAWRRHHYRQTGTWADDGVRARLFGNSQEVRRFLKGVAARVPFEHWIWFAYHFIFRLGFLEGRRGLIAARLRAQYIQQVTAKEFEIRRELAKDRHRSANRDGQ